MKKPAPKSVTIEVNWDGDPAAGIAPGSEEVRLSFRYGGNDPDFQFELQESVCDLLAQFYEGEARPKIKTGNKNAFHKA